MTLRRVAGLWVIALIACLVATACTTTVDGTPVPATGSADHPAGEPPRAPKPPDRDPQAVSVALRTLDACAVLDLNAARVVGLPQPSLQPMGPHSCMLVPKAKYTPAVHGVEVRVGDGSNTFFTYHGAPITLDGAKAYEYRDYSSSSKRCHVAFPVSFTRAIVFKYDTFDDVDTCRVLRPIAEAAVAKLRNPDTITVDAAQRPFAAWDGCQFLAQTLGADAEKYTYKPDGVRDPFSGCETARKKTDNSTVDRSASPKLEVSYNQVPTAPKESRQIGGKVAEVRSYSGFCTVSWNQGDSRTGNEWFAALVIKVTAATCEAAAHLADKAVPLADQGPGDGSARPQRPVLFTPQDNDTGMVGACVDFNVAGGQADCEPYHDVPVPNGVDTIMAAAATNRNMQCAVFSDTVKALFGPTMGALTWGAHCFFVEPTHTLLLRVNVDPDNPPSDYGKAPDLYIERRETQIGGKPAVTFWDKHKNSFDVYLSPWGDLTRKGNVHVHIQALRGRGDIAIKTVTLEQTKADAAVQAITQITQRYFSD